MNRAIFALIAVISSLFGNVTDLDNKPYHQARIYHQTSSSTYHTLTAYHKAQSYHRASV